MKRMVMSPKIKGMAVVPNMKHTAMARGIKKMAASSRMKHRAMRPERANMWMAGAMGMMAAGAGAAGMVGPKKTGQKKRHASEAENTQPGGTALLLFKGKLRGVRSAEKAGGDR